MAASTSFFSKRVGLIVKDLRISRNGSSTWYTPHMAAAARAIVERIPLVDFVVEVRDARIPLSSGFEPIRQVCGSCRRIVLLNKVDLADRVQTERWIRSFQERNCLCYAVNSHNRDNIHGLLNFIRTRVRELGVDESYTATFMLVGIPNVGKSAIVNATHQLGRISAEEKGKLKHAIVTSQPGETKDISNFKIASHPNIYVLDTPGVLSPEIPELELGSKLALTGAVNDSLTGKVELAQYFLALLNSGNQYKSWEKLNTVVNDGSYHNQNSPLGSNLPRKRRKQYPSDHTQDFVVREVRRTLYKTISSFKGKMEDEVEMSDLIKTQFLALHEAFSVSPEREDDGHRTVAAKLLNLYRTGRLGRYTLDNVPCDVTSLMNM